MVGAWVTPTGLGVTFAEPGIALTGPGVAGAEEAGRAVLSAFTVVSASTGRPLPDSGPATVPSLGQRLCRAPNPAPVPGPAPVSGKRLPACPEGYVCAYTSLKG